MKHDLVRQVCKNLCFLIDGSRNDDGPQILHISYICSQMQKMYLKLETFLYLSNSETQ